MFFYRSVDYQQNSNLRKSSPNDRQRTQEQTQLHTVPATIVSAPSNARLCSQMRSSLLPATIVSAPACADSRYLRGAKHCSSLCSQSEGDEYCGGQARDENPTKLYPRALAMFAMCSWPSLCEQSELQCWRRNRRLCEHKSPLQGSCLQPRVFKIKKSLCAVLSQMTWQLRRCP